WARERDESSDATAQHETGNGVPPKIVRWTECADAVPRALVAGGGAKGQVERLREIDRLGEQKSRRHLEVAESGFAIAATGHRDEERHIETELKAPIQWRIRGEPGRVLIATVMAPVEGEEKEAIEDTVGRVQPTLAWSAALTVGTRGPRLSPSIAEERQQVQLVPSSRLVHITTARVPHHL